MAASAYRVVTLCVQLVCNLLAVAKFVYCLTHHVCLSFNLTPPHGHVRLVVLLCVLCMLFIMHDKNDITDVISACFTVCENVPTYILLHY